MRREYTPANEVIQDGVESINGELVNQGKGGDRRRESRSRARGLEVVVDVGPDRRREGEEEECLLRERHYCRDVGGGGRW